MGLKGLQVSRAAGGWAWGGLWGHSLPLCLPRVSRDHRASASRDLRWVYGAAVPCCAVLCHASWLCQLSHTGFPRENPGALDHPGHP